MSPKLSAGLLLYRRRPELEVLLAHMGGPYWAHQDDGAWSIPKGEYQPDDNPFAAARREFEEELGSPAPSVPYRELGSVRQPGGKVVIAWAGEADFEVANAVSNTFDLEWPRGSGRMQSFPEIDRVAWFAVDRARTKLVRGQAALLDQLTRTI